MKMKRSKYIEGVVPRLQKNEITAWIDGSMIYGSDADKANKLRSFSKGRLRTSGQNLLPTIQEQGHELFEAGDTRANENIFLTTYHTAFMREHNRLCEKYAALYPELSD